MYDPMKDSQILAYRSQVYDLFLENRPEIEMLHASARNAIRTAFIAAFNLGALAGARRTREVEHERRTD